jgi:hypothetical protein
MEKYFFTKLAPEERHCSVNLVRLSVSAGKQLACQEDSETSRPLEAHIKQHKYYLTWGLLEKSKLAQHAY